MYISSLIVLDSPPRLLSSSQYTLANPNGLLVLDLCDLASMPWLLLISMKMDFCHLTNTP